MAPASAIKVLIVDDSALVRQVLTRVLGEDPNIVIVGSARDGVEALEKAASLRPDVITLDIEMPELDGIEVLRRLDRHSNARVVILSSIDDAATTYLALSLGAVEFVPKPVAGVVTAIDDLSETLRAKIRMAYHVAPGQAAAIARLTARAEQAAASNARAAAPSRTVAGETAHACVALAASTGGPAALAAVFSAIPAGLSAAFVVVQHLPAGFAASLARRLTSVGGVPFAVAEQGMVLEAGHGYVAAHGTHLAVATGRAGTRRFELRHDAAMHGVRPAADVLMESVAAAYGPQGIGVVLTGMGRDGAQGALAMRKAGGLVVVQDEATSVVWGMPRAAATAGACDEQLALDLVGPRLLELIAQVTAEKAD